MLKDNIFTKVGLFVFRHWLVSLLVWLALLAGGILSYTQLIAKDGFPQIEVPISIVAGSHASQDPQVVDQEISQPLGQALSEATDLIDKIESQAKAGRAALIVHFKSGAGLERRQQLLSEALDETGLTSDMRILNIEPAAFLAEYDLLVAVYDPDQETGQPQPAVTERVAVSLEEIVGLERVDIVPFSLPNSPRQQAYNQFGILEDGQLNYYLTDLIGIDRRPDQLDTLGLSEAVDQKLASLELGSHRALIAADFAVDIRDQLDSLESNLLTGVLVIVAISYLLITWRAALVTSLFMATVILVTILAMYLVGYSLNVISLFALILAIGLFVDDATIVVEAIDIHRRQKRKRPAEVVKLALRKISLASFAGTLTTVLVFLPLALTTGVLGGFIRIMPITISLALLISFLLSITLIPVLSRFLILRHKKDSWLTRINFIPRLEHYLANASAAIPNLVTSRPVLGKAVMVNLIVISFVLIIGSLGLAGRLGFNIFPPTADGPQISLQLTYPDGYDLDNAQAVTTKANAVIASELAGLVESVNYAYVELPDQDDSLAIIQLIPMDDREETSVELADRLQAVLETALNDRPADKAAYPLVVQLRFDDQALGVEAKAVAQDIKDYLLEQPDFVITDGQETFGVISEVRVGEVSPVVASGQWQISLWARYQDNDRPTTELLQASQAILVQPGISLSIPNHFSLNFDQIIIEAKSLSPGPEALAYPFVVQIKADDDLDQATALAEEIRTYLIGGGRDIMDDDEVVATVVDAKFDDVDTVIERANGQRQISLRARYHPDALVTTQILNLTRDSIKEQFADQVGNLGFDFGQESSNEESFNALVFIFPLILVAMYVLLALQFRSFLQPFLILLAVPFTLPGVMIFLYVTDTPMSFFTRLGFLGLVGITVNNTILLVTYANSEKRDGASHTAAIVEAVRKRFRPLVATTLTTVFAILPLALDDPFWTSLSLVIIWGLVSSVILVLVTFPAYYLALGKISSHFSKKDHL